MTEFGRRPVETGLPEAVTPAEFKASLVQFIADSGRRFKLIVDSSGEVASPLSFNGLVEAEAASTIAAINQSLNAVGGISMGFDENDSGDVEYGKLVGCEGFDTDDSTWCMAMLGKGRSTRLVELNNDAFGEGIID